MAHTGHWPVEAVWDDWRMGLDVYVGPLSRYLVGDWLTIVQQAGAATGTVVQIHRASPQPDDAITDLAQVLQVVEQWRAVLTHAVGAEATWPEGHDLPYFTDKPGWEGYGGLILLAAYEERPDLRPQARGFFGLRRRRDSTSNFAGAAAYRAASAKPSRYPTLLAGAEWWLPITADPGVFLAATPAGPQVLMGTVDQLVAELEDLAMRTRLDDARLAESLEAGPPPSEYDVEEAGRFGLAVFLTLARQATANRQPLLLDY